MNIFRSIKDYCEDKLIEYPEEYIQSLLSRYNTTKYARDELQLLLHNEIARKVDKIGFANADIVFNSILNKSTINLEASINIGYSLYDITAQIINAIFLEKPYKENFVKFNKLNDMIKDELIQAKINDIDKSDEKQFLFAYMNTVKHRKLIEIRYNIGSYTGPVIKEFYYNERSFNEKKSDEVFCIIDQSMKNMIDLLSIILNTFSL